MRDRLISLFQRTTSAKNFIPEIDGLRFLAIITVVIFHFHFQLFKTLGDAVEIDFVETDFTSAGWWLVRLDLGVKVFFGISGFILSIPFWKQYHFRGNPVNLKEYFIRRLTRLEPPFVLAVSGFFLVHVLVMHESFRELFPHFLVTLLYAHTLVFNEYSTILPVTWSLETEVQFYLLIPFLSALVLKSNSRVRMISWAAVLFFGSIAFRAYLLKIGIYGLMASIPAFFSHFMVGIIFAYLYLTREKWLRSKSVGWDLVGILAFLGMFFFYKPQSDFLFQVLFNCSIFLLFCAAFKGYFTNRFMVFTPIYLIGGMCYSIYLLHLPLFGLFVIFSKKLLIAPNYSTAFWTQFPIALLALLCISGLYYLAVEKPCMDKNWHLRLAKKLGLRNFS